MRLRNDPVLCFEWTAPKSSELKIVVRHQEKYQRIGRILDQNPKILALADADLKVLSSSNRNGRRAVYTSENLLRALVVMVVEGLDLRGTVVRIAESPFLQDFLRLGNRPVMDFTFLERAFKAIRPETWKAINAVLAGWARGQKRMDPSHIRADTTVVQTNIHYPSDATLLWDSWRVLERLLRRGRGLDAALCPHRFHGRKVKELFCFITRYSKSRSGKRQRGVRRRFAKLIARVRWLHALATKFCADSLKHRNFDVQLLAYEVAPHLPRVKQVADVAERAGVKGEKVPAAERIYSLFEPHTELICRGKAGKPVEFGHVIRLCQTREKFITDYDAMERRVRDNELADPMIESHKQLFGAAPEVFAADHGFSPAAPKRAALEQKVRTFASPRCLRDWGSRILVKWQRFRAGIEGSISVLKRAFGLGRCLFRGFRSFAAAVGMAVVCHNLVLLAGTG